MPEPTPATPPDLSCFEPAVLFWARHRLPACARGKLDPAELMQQTLLEAIGKGGMGVVYRARGL